MAFSTTQAPAIITKGIPIPSPTPRPTFVAVTLLPAPVFDAADVVVGVLLATAIEESGDAETVAEAKELVVKLMVEVAALVGLEDTVDDEVKVVEAVDVLFGAVVMLK